eukprot:jgi/Chrzof1/666/Cz01g24120.t1
MQRAKSYATVNVTLASDWGKGSVSDKGPNGLYTAAKTIDVPFCKQLKSYAFWVRHKLLACCQTDRSACLALLLGLLVVSSLWVLHLHIATQVQQPRYLILLDAGSTGTRVHIFKYGKTDSTGYTKIHLPEPKLKVEPGLSFYASNPASAAASLQPLLNFAYKHVPPEHRRRTPIKLMATAGLRLLPTHASQQILQQCSALLSASQFMFQPGWAEVISGQYEGVFAWTAVNYAAGTLQAAARVVHSRKESRHPPHFKGLLELGGASAQVTFIPERALHEGGPHPHLPGDTAMLK